MRIHNFDRTILVTVTVQWFILNVETEPWCLGSYPRRVPTGSRGYMTGAASGSDKSHLIRKFLLKSGDVCRAHNERAMSRNYIILMHEGSLF